MTEKELARIAAIEASGGFEKFRPAADPSPELSAELARLTAKVLGELKSAPADLPQGIPPTVRNIFT